MTENSRLEHSMVEGYSLEVSAKSLPVRLTAAEQLVPGTAVFIPWLAGEDDQVRLTAARAVRALGFEPVPHLSARRIASHAELRSLMLRMVEEAGVKRCLVIAGDPATTTGPFSDSLTLIDTGLLEQAGIQAVGIGGHPAGHPIMDSDRRWQVLAHKLRSIEARGMTPFIVSQFAFDADVVLAWLNTLRDRGIHCPVRIGVPGPTSVTALARYAAMCGVSATASILAKYGISLGKLLVTAGPDRFIERLVDGLTPAHGEVRLHFFPFGGVAKSVQWIEAYRNGHPASRLPRRA